MAPINKRYPLDNPQDSRHHQNQTSTCLNGDPASKKSTSHGLMCTLPPAHIAPCTLCALHPAQTAPCTHRTLHTVHDASCTLCTLHPAHNAP
eukprot:scaffold301641_cov26-Tisochrysis_lutea.AAC.1